MPHHTRFPFRPFPTLAALLSAFALASCGGGGGGAAPTEPLTIIEANIDTLAAQIGGGTQDVERYHDGSTDWALYTMANRFAATPVGMSKGAVHEIVVPGYIQHITLVKGWGERNYALLSMGGKGIGVVDITNPAAMSLVRTMTVNYLTPEYTYSDGGGTVFTQAAATDPLTGGPVNDVLVDDQGTPDTADDQLYIANTAFGIQKTALANLMNAEGSGVLTIDSGAWTLKYSGENPWGGPLSLKLHGGKLYAALGFLGIGVYDKATLNRLGAYNLYADCSSNEDWFGFPNRKPACPGTNVDVVAGGVDADGVPTYLQAAAELGEKNDLPSYPWAEFDRYGKYYYNARALDLVDLPGGQTMAYIAYSLGGLVAVDMTDVASPAYQGYVPAAPAHGPDEPPVNVEKKGILSHFGSGMLKEAGVMDVRVVPTSSGASQYRAYYTDHFAGLVVASGAEAPVTHWRNTGGPFNNDTDARVYWPDYEFVRSYDMTPVPVGDESLPRFLTASNGNYSAPVMLVTGEINGHGGSLFLMPNMNPAAAGQVDLVESSGAGGVSFVDLIDLTSAGVEPANRFAVPVNLVSTNETGAFENGSPGQPIAVGHAEGVTISGDHLYLADGPHGVSVWRIANGLTPIDDLHLVANTLQSEYPTGSVMPTPHAFKVAFGADPNQAYVMSQSLGMRRLNVTAVNTGAAQVGAPRLLDSAGNIFEHNTEAGSVGAVKINGQDHAYGVTFHGRYAIVADGNNGLTVYDTTVDPATGLHVVDNIGGTMTGKAPVGRAASVKLWTNPANNRKYAVVAAGAYGVSVVDMTERLDRGIALDVSRHLVKTFEPLKADDDNAFGSADGKSVDVHVIGDIAYFSYDSFGLVAYRMADLVQPAGDIKPECAGVDPTKLSAKQGGIAECRPLAVGYFKLQKLAGYETMDGGALYMTPQYFPAGVPLRDGNGTVYTLSQPRLLFYVAYGDAGVVKVDWSNVAQPTLMAIHGVVGGAGATAIHNGRVYVAAGAGGLTVLK